MEGNSCKSVGRLARQVDHHILTLNRSRGSDRGDNKVHHRILLLVRGCEENCPETYLARVVCMREERSRREKCKLCSRTYEIALSRLGTLRATSVDASPALVPLKGGLE